MAKKEYDNTNTGILFKNEEKDDDNPNWPDYKGSIDIEGDEFWMSGWVKECKSGKLEGKKIISLSFQPKEKRGRGSSGGSRGRDRDDREDRKRDRSDRDDDDRKSKKDGGDDDIPF